MLSTGDVRERGANLVEAALVLPLLILLLVFVVDLGRAYFTYITMIDVAREGARWGANNYTKADAEIQAAALAEATNQPIGIVNLSAANVDVNNSGVEGSFVSVTVHIDDFPLLMGGLIGLPTFPMSYQVAFRIRCRSGC